METLRGQILRVPGATLAYEVCGSGPLLLLIAGGGNDGSAFHGIVRALANDYSVVTYDRRGLGESRLDDEDEIQRVEVHSDDAHWLLKYLGSDYEPAYVFGSSGGAVVALDLVARHPEQIRTVIAHEPPTHLWSQADPIREMGAVRAVYLQRGVEAALGKLVAQSYMSMEESEPQSGRAEALNRERMMKNLRFLFEQEFLMYDRYQIDFDALKRAREQAQILIGAGEANQGDSGYHSACAVAERLGTELVTFPGRHVGYFTNPASFSRRLLQVLDSRDERM
jgi:pimeloyl-ACP methyl ester carboxylesterase